MTQLVNQTVLVTGANRGMGREFVRQLLDRGVAKVYAAARDPQTIVADDPRVVPLQLDVTDAGSVARAAETANEPRARIAPRCSRPLPIATASVGGSKPTCTRSEPTKASGPSSERVLTT